MEDHWKRSIILFDNLGYWFLPSDMLRVAIMNIRTRTVVSRYSQTRGIAPSSLNPGLLIYIPSGEGFEQIQYRGQRIPEFSNGQPQGPPLQSLRLFCLSVIFPSSFHLLVRSFPRFPVSIFPSPHPSVISVFPSCLHRLLVLSFHRFIFSVSPSYLSLGPKNDIR